MVCGAERGGSAHGEFRFRPAGLPDAPRRAPASPSWAPPGMRARPAATPSRLPARVPLSAAGLLPAAGAEASLIRLASPQSPDLSGRLVGVLVFIDLSPAFINFYK